MYKLDNPDFVSRRKQIIEDFKKVKSITTKNIPFQKYSEYFIELSSRIHENKYDYSKTHYLNNKTKVIITCYEHGDFEIRPYDHLRGVGCKKCNLNYDELTATNNDSFINLSKQIHGENTFTYSKVNFKSMNQKVILICNECNLEFEVTPFNHLRKQTGCPHCNRIKAGKSHLWDKEKFVEEARKIYGDKYDYSESIYVDTYTPLKVKCKEHDEFFYVTPSNHIHEKQGCPICSHSISKGEREIIKYLENHHIEFYHRYVFEDCKLIRNLIFDFYLPDYNACVEFQGRQHYEAIDYWGGEENLKYNQERDQIKRDFCRSKSIYLLEIKYDQDIENTLDNFLQNR